MVTELGYYEIDEALLIEQGFVDDLFEIKDLKQRKLFLNGDISPENVAPVVKHILQFNKEDMGVDIEKRNPILLYITSDGGDVDSGFSLVDAIVNSKTPVYTINLAYQFSMAFLIGMVGKKRISMPNAKFLMHDGSRVVCNSTSKAKEQMEFYNHVDEKCKDLVLKYSKISSEYYDEKLQREWYMFADEAKECGFTDMIIGLDCDIDTVI